MSEPKHSDRTERVLATLCLGLVLLFHIWGATVGWNNLNLPGCEFRQTQTAVSAHFILKEKNYSLAYPTPILGKPWSIPLEFPLYQWTVAKVAEETGWGLTQVGRGVSLVCFYLTLPALYLLLRQLGLPYARALVVLGFVLCCPLYIFYARSFLIETMAWMFGAWFLLGYEMGVRKRSPAWLAVAMVGGVGAALVKITTLAAFLVPAFLRTLHWLWQDWRENPPARWPLLRGRVLWCAAAVGPAGVASWWWVGFSDRLKALSPTAEFLQSARISNYTLGVGSRFDPAIWAQQRAVIFHELASVPVLILAGIIILFLARAWWWTIGWLLACFFAVQLAFPILYAWHEYYYVAIAMLLMAVIGLAMCALLESRLPRWLAWLVIAGCLAVQGRSYVVRHYAEQKQTNAAGSELTVALRRITEPDDVIVVAGNDWSSIIPYYAERRALMIRRDLETTWQVIEPAFAALKEEPVTALVLCGKQRENRALLDRAVAAFGLDPRPAFQWGEADVFLHARHRSLDLAILAGVPGLTLPPEATDIQKSRMGREVDMSGWAPRHQAGFELIAPLPWKYFSAFGLNSARYQERDYLWIHPETRFWFRLPAGQHRMVLNVQFLPDAYDEKMIWQDRSDGVELVLTVRTTGGGAREAGRRLIDPRDHPVDRGLLAVEFDFTVEPGAELELAVLPGPAGSLARDWLLLHRLKIE